MIQIFDRLFDYNEALRCNLVPCGCSEDIFNSDYNGMDYDFSGVMHTNDPELAKAARAAFPRATIILDRYPKVVAKKHQKRRKRHKR